MERLNKCNPTLAVAVHGDMTREERESALSEFGKCSSRVLVATDGIRMTSTSACVVNFDFPSSSDGYARRVGNGGAGAFGRKGIVVSFTCPADVTQMRQTEADYMIRMADLPVDYASLIGE